MLGVAANCASALAQMAAASCVQEEKEEKELGETGDAIAQGIHTHFTLCIIFHVASLYSFTVEGCTDIIWYWVHYCALTDTMQHMLHTVNFGINWQQNKFQCHYSYLHRAADAQSI